MLTIDFAPARKAIRARHSKLRFDDVLTEGYRLRFIPVRMNAKSFDTACWCYLPKEKAHLITFGERLADKLERGSLDDYSLAYYHHEVEHSFSTERDLVALSKDLKDAGILFKMFNLAEDARIEALARARWGRPFNWLSFEKQEIGHAPHELLFNIIQADGDCTSVKSLIADPGVKAKTFPFVENFYRRFIAAPSSRALIPILKDWIDKGGAQPEDDPCCDLAVAAAVQAGEIKLDGIDCDHEGDEGGGPTPPVETGSYTISESGNHDFLAEGQHTDLNPDIVDFLAAAMKKAFKGGMRKVSTCQPSKRMNLRALVRGSELIYRRKVNLADGRRRRVRIFFDCSGSMNSCKKAGLHLMGALSALAQSGVIEAKLILTKANGRKAVHQVFALPMPLDAIAQIPTNGGAECFDAAMKKTAKILEPGDLVLAFTDGNINDEKIERAYWRRRGVFSIGLYVGEDLTEVLHQWFDAALCRERVEDLAIGLAELFKEKRRCCV
jgi:hypothetical protein